MNHMASITNDYTNAVEADLTDTGNSLPRFTVGIGASAGGLEAIETFFKALPADTGGAFVVVQHLSPEFKSRMKELLAHCTNMKIYVVDSPVKIAPNTVYLAPPRKEIILEGIMLSVREISATETLHLPINIFLSSLAVSCHEKAIAIILSGTGSDGSNGIIDIHSRGGLVIAQNGETARFDGMPKNAQLTGCVDLILPPEAMPAALLEFVYRAKSPNKSQLPSIHNHEHVNIIGLILERLKNVYGVDFSTYKPGTIGRRLERRKSINNLETSEEYYEKIKQEPEELELLYKDLLIGVTRFFRDTAAFAIIENQVIPALLEQVPLNEEIRVWVAGCASGEEAYSIAMLLVEACESRGRPVKVKIFATDIHPDSLKMAASGIYPLTALEDVSAPRLAKFFIDLGEYSYQVVSSLRKLVIFSSHNLMKDPPFTQLNMVSCRNLLIYLRAEAQEKIITAFHYGLEKSGILFLGPSEGLGDLSQDFELIDHQWKVFRKKEQARRLPRLEMANPVLSRGKAQTPHTELPLMRIYDSLLATYVKQGVLLNESKEVIHVFGDVKSYLKFSVGRPSMDVMTLLEPDLRIAVSSALQNALKNKVRVEYGRVHVASLGAEIHIAVDVIEDNITHVTYFMLVFTPENDVISNSNTAPTKVFVMETEASARIEQLEYELQTTKEHLQRVVEQLETTNEELQSSNEELLVSNEELQSTNEELHSVNEELYSINSEHEAKIKELNIVAGDLQNLIRATNIGTLFVSLKKRIRFFTPEATKLFNVLPHDVGRDLAHITSRVENDNVGEEIDQVIHQERAILQHVKTRDGSTFMRKVSPYYDLDKQMTGVVISFVDVSELVSTEERLSAQGRLLSHITNNLPGLVAYWDKENICRFANIRFVEWLSLDECLIVGNQLINIHQANMTQISPYIELVSKGERCIFEQEIRLKDGSLLPCMTSYIPDMVDGEVSGFIELSIDISNLKKIMVELAEKTRIAEAASQAKSEFVANVSHELRTPLNVVLGMAELLSSEPLDEHQLEYLHDIQAAGRGLLKVINEILDFAKIDAGKMILDAQPTALVSILDDVKVLLSSMAQAKGLTWGANLQLDEEQLYIFDATKLQRVIVNLVSNAVKFTSEGFVKLTVIAQEVQYDRQWIYVSVQDTGIGIPAQYQDRIFSPFSQADSSITRKYGGTGLGLAINRKIVELMGGEIGLKSEEGQGSEFWFRIPLQLGMPINHDSSSLAVANNKKEKASPLLFEQKREKLRGLRILIVDDFDLNRRLLKKMLQQVEVITVEADNGQKAVDYLSAHDDIDMVLMDIQMPVMSGLDATRFIRKQLKNETLPIIAISAGILQEEKKEAYSAGMNAFISKPIDMKAALAEIENVVTLTRKDSKNDGS